MTKKPKIALVYDAIYPYVKGGGERRFHDISIRLAKQGMDVHLYGIKFWNGPNVIKRNGVYLHGIMKSRPLYNKSGGRNISEALLFGIASFKLLKEDFDVIDCCGFPYFSLFACKLITLLRCKPLFSTWHEVWGKEYWVEYMGTLGYVGYNVERFAAKLPNYIIAASQHTSDDLSRLLHVRSIFVVPNGVDLKTINNIVPSKKKSDIIYAGRLMDFKNIDLIIECLAELKSRNIKLKCCIIGEGPAKARLQKLAKKLNVATQIDWLGFLDKSEDVYANIKSSKVFVLPSKREGFGIVTVEANACGKPVLTANFAQNAAKDLIQPGVNGYLFEPTVSDLSVVIERVLKEIKKLESPTLNFVQTYDWNNLLSKIVEVYAQ